MLLAVRGCRTGASDSDRSKRVMFGLGLATKIYIAVEAFDMGFEGLHGLVRRSSGVYAKHLEKGRFRWPEADHVRSVTMRAEELATLVNGLDLKQTKLRAWYRKSA